MGVADASPCLQERRPTGAAPQDHRIIQRRRRPQIHRNHSRDGPTPDGFRGVDRPTIFVSPVQVGFGRDVSTVSVEVGEGRGLDHQLHAAPAALQLSCAGFRGFLSIRRQDSETETGDVGGGGGGAHRRRWVRGTVHGLAAPLLRGVRLAGGRVPNAGTGEGVGGEGIPGAKDSRDTGANLPWAWGAGGWELGGMVGWGRVQRCGHKLRESLSSKVVVRTIQRWV